MKSSQLLRQAAKVLTKTRWIQGFSALTKTGERVSTSSKKACKFCATGALARVADIRKNGIEPYLDAAKFLDNAVRGKYKGNVVEFNDAKGRKYEQVIETYKRAIAAAKKAGK